MDGELLRVGESPRRRRLLVAALLAAVLGTEPTASAQKAKDSDREDFGLIAGQDWLGSSTEMISLRQTLM
jgi:hypothetical protein